MPVNFPSNPTNGQSYSSDGRTWTFNGTGWVLGYTAATAGGDLTGTFPNPSIGTGKVTSTHILDGTIATADIADLAVTSDKLADLVINAQTASYTLVLTDKNKLVEISNAAANTLTVPANASVAFPTGSQVHFVQTGAGQTTLTPDAGVTINGTPGLKLRTQWSSATLIKRATNTWVAFGDLVS